MIVDPYCQRQRCNPLILGCKALPKSELNLTVGSNTIQPVKSVHDLGVHLDTELSTKTHVSKVASSYLYQLRRLRQIRRLVVQNVTAQLRTYFPGWTTVILS